jgi:hypothetical protein
MKFMIPGAILYLAFICAFITMAQMYFLMSVPIHKRSSNSPELPKPRMDHSYSNKTTEAMHDTIVYAIVTPYIAQAIVNTGSERQTLVESSLKTWPALRRFNASYQLDASCVSILKYTQITVSAYYYSEERGVGWIHAGKVGHWCSFLRYMYYCNTSNAVVCVWIEDDFKLSAHNIHKIESEAANIAKTNNNKYAVISLGLGDEVNIIDSRLLHLLFNQFHNFEIRKPLDITLRTTHLGRVRRVFDKHDRMFIGKETSTLVCPTCKLISVKTVNQLINTSGHM